MALPTHFKLNTGAQIPAVGLGTMPALFSAGRSEIQAHGDLNLVRYARQVSFALKNGYSHIDAALRKQARFWGLMGSLGNEHEVGQGIKDSGVPRENIFITSKLWNTHQPNVAEGLQKTLDALGTDYLDLYNESSELLPVNPDGTRSIDRSWGQSETWRQMEEVYKAGKVKAIGVANWSIPYLEELKKKWTVVPAVNQVELHPFLPQHALKEWCDKHGILLEAYSPLGSEGLRSAHVRSRNSGDYYLKKHGVSPATVLISYHINRGVVVLPKSTKENRIVSNRQVILLSREDMDVLNGLAVQGKARRINTPLFGWDLGFDDWYNQ
ncbi:D-galacturonate reductase [Aspergillus lentulus]|nr:D-galacturonate reductase [Aspergillus lentulus]